MSLHLSVKLTTNYVPLSRIKWEIYFYIYVFLVVHKDTVEYTTRAQTKRSQPRCVPAQRLLSHLLGAYLLYFHLKYRGEHKALKFFSGGVVMPYLYFLRGPSNPHSLTHSSTQYISNHPSPSMLQRAIGRLKTPNEMYDFIYRDDYLFTRMAEKTWKRKGNERKIPVWLPSHPRFYDMEADCFPVSENAENNPDLP